MVNFGYFTLWLILLFLFFLPQAVHHSDECLRDGQSLPQHISQNPEDLHPLDYDHAE